LVGFRLGALHGAATLALSGRLSPGIEATLTTAAPGSTTTLSIGHAITPGIGRSPTAAPSTQAAPVLTATKLHIPPMRPGAIRRTRLISALIAGAATKLTLIDALPGSGKTSLLSEWHASPSERRSFAWLSLDGADNDPVRFCGGLIAALQTVIEDLGSSAQTALHSPGATLQDHVLPLLINDLAGISDFVVLVLDDYHLIANTEIHRAIEVLIERLPMSVQLVLATRSDPPLPLGRLRARGQLTEIRADDLRFTAAEAESFLNGVLELSLDEDEVAALHERTEGWAAGLQLAGLSLRGREDRRRFIDAFAGDDQQIVDYLGAEVLDQQPPAIREFLLRSSILDRLSAPLCAAVTESTDAAGLLRALERENLFVVPLDSRREWSRYHHLFAALLRHQLSRTEPELVPELHRRASAWYRQAGAIHEAIGHAISGAHFADATELITAHWYELLQQGLQETVAAWIDRLPPEAVTSDVGLCLTMAWLGVNTGRLDEVERWIDAAETAAAERAACGELPPLESGIASLRAIHRYMDGNVTAAVAAGRYALELEAAGPPTPWRPVGCPVLGLALHWHGRNDDAARTLAEAVTVAKTNGNHLAAMHASGGLAAISYERGDLEGAALHAGAATQLAEEHNLGEHWASSLSLTVRGQLLEDHGELEEADRVIDRAVALASRGVAAIEIAYSLDTLARVRQRQQRHDEAAALRRRAQAVVRACADPGILRARLTQTERGPRSASTATAPVDNETLSAAELNVLRLLRSEMPQREIAAELQLSFNTIKTHTRNIYRKLGASTRAEALTRARSRSVI
jgi:LuxR family maltose regulon positive regulatory protein